MNLREDDEKRPAAGNAGVQALEFHGFHLGETGEKVQGGCARV